MKPPKLVPQKMHRTIAVSLTPAQLEHLETVAIGHCLGSDKTRTEATLWTKIHEAIRVAKEDPEPERAPCRSCGRVVAHTKNGFPRHHRCPHGGACWASELDSHRSFKPCKKCREADAGRAALGGES